MIEHIHGMSAADQRIAMLKYAQNLEKDPGFMRNHQPHAGHQGLISGVNWNTTPAAPNPSLLAQVKKMDPQTRAKIMHGLQSPDESARAAAMALFRRNLPGGQNMAVSHGGHHQAWNSHPQSALAAAKAMDPAVREGLLRDLKSGNPVRAAAAMKKLNGLL
jgi:hypothetical protein